MVLLTPFPLVTRGKTEPPITGEHKILRISVWDELCSEWTTHELDIPETTRDPETINLALGASVMNSEDGDG